MHHMWGMLSKPVDEGQTNHSDVKDQDTANVGDTGVESLCSVLSRCDAHNSLQYEDIRKENDQCIEKESQGNQNNWVHAVKGNVSTCKLHDILVEAEGMRKNMGTAVWEPK